MMLEDLRQRKEQLDERMLVFMKVHGVRVLRIALGVIFMWFGALKVLGVSPVADLVANTVYWFPPGAFVPFLGAWEVLIGLGLFWNRALRTTLFLFWLQMAGTFLVLVLRPDVAFQGGNPLLLTTEGEFVVKNLVLIAAGIVVGGSIRRKDKSAIVE